MLRFSFPRFCPSSLSLSSSAAISLQRTALHQLHKELQRDIEENTGANQPTPPKGWHVKRTPGSCTFQLSSICRFADNTNSNNNIKNLHQRKKMIISDRTQKKQEFAPSPSALLSSSASSGGGENSWTSKIDIFCRFETMDPSFWEPSIGICEYVPFRIVMERVAPPLTMRTKTATKKSSSSSNSSHDNNDDDLVMRSSYSSSSNRLSSIHSNLMIIDCAFVQSQLRIRRLFFAPSSDRQALEDESSIGMAHGVFCGPEISHAPLQAVQSVKTSNSSSSASSSTMEISKTISKELYQATMELLSSCGIDNRLGEYICQCAYCYEHEEYELWLAKLADFSSKSFSHHRDVVLNENADDGSAADDGSGSLSSSENHDVAKDVIREEYQNSKLRSQNVVKSDFDDLDDSERETKMKKIAGRMSDVLERASSCETQQSVSASESDRGNASSNSNKTMSQLSRSSNSSSLTGKPRKRGGSLPRNRV